MSRQRRLAGAARALPAAPARGRGAWTTTSAYRGLAAGDIDVTDLYSTDAEIALLPACASLEDDRGAFSRATTPSCVYRRDAEARWPGGLRRPCAGSPGAIDARRA